MQGIDPHSIQLPPPLRLHAVTAGDPVDHAVKRAVSGTDPGLLVWLVDHRVLSMAILLCPDDADSPLLTLPALALAEALEADGPPRMHMALGIDGVFSLNGAVLGRVRVTLPEMCTPLEWAVLSIDATVSTSASVMEAGLTPDQTSLTGEGLGSITVADLLQRVAHHLRYWLSVWEEDGPQAITAAWDRRVVRWENLQKGG